MQKRRRIWLTLVVLIAIAAAWFWLTSHNVPEGQPPLVTLDAASFGALRADFNRDVGQVRMIVLLAPT